MNYLYFTNSVGQQLQINFQAHSYFSLMDFILDQGYEDWGDCRGRAWCASCHVNIDTTEALSPIDSAEQKRLDQLSNSSVHSRLACQIPLDKNIHAKTIVYIGDD